jgi:hypothetical protein
MTEPRTERRSATWLFALVTVLSGCAPVADSNIETDALYQRGALPAAPWVPANLDGDDSAGEGDDPPIADGSGGEDSPAANGGTGGAGMSGAGMGGAGGMGGNMIKPGSGGAGASGSGGMSGSGGAGPSSGAKPTKVTLDFTTLPQGGRYQPKNIGVVWIQNASGDYITAIEIWAGFRARYLRKWLGVNPFGDSADAVSSATLRMHETHSATWDLKDSDGSIVPDGDYTLFIEVTDKDAAGISTSVDFTKGPEPQTVMVPDAQYYTGVKLTYE